MSGLYDPNEYEKAYEDYEKLMEIVRSKGYKKGWAFYVLKEKYGHWLATVVVNDYEPPIGEDNNL